LLTSTENLHRKPFKNSQQLSGLTFSPWGPLTTDQEIAFLRGQAQMVKQQMDQIDARIKESEKELGRFLLR
jgi:hypothetical protein